MAQNGLQTKEHTYRNASRAFDYFVTGLSSILFLATVFFFDRGQGAAVSSLLKFAAVALFAMAVFAGLKKLEYYVAILGADYSLAMTEGNNALGARESAAIIRDLNETVDRLSARASFTHRFRNWCLVFGILSVIAERLLEVAI